MLQIIKCKVRNGSKKRKSFQLQVFPIQKNPLTDIWIHKITTLENNHEK